MAGAQAARGLLAGLEVVGPRDAGPGAAPVFGLAPHELAVSEDGAVVNVMLSGFVVVDPLVEDLYGRVRPAWFDATRELSASEVEDHVLRLLAWRGGRKVLVVRPSELIPGLCKVDLHLLPEATAGGAGTTGSLPRRGASRWAVNYTHFRVPFARVRGSPNDPGRMWTQLLCSALHPPVEPLAEVLGLPVERCRSLTKEPHEISALDWMTLDLGLAGVGPDAVYMHIWVRRVSTADGRFVRVASGYPGAEAQVQAALAVARAWPGGTVLFRAGMTPGVGTHVWLRIGEHPEVPHATGPLAQAALRMALQGGSAAALSERLRDLWADVRALRALCTLAAL